MAKKIIFLILILICVSTILTFIFSSNHGKKETEIKKECKKVSFLNWKEYTDLSILRDFEKDTGIKVILYEYETMPMMIAEVQSNPGKYDVIMIDGDIVSVMKELKLIDRLDPEKIPNFKNVKKDLLEKPMYEHQGKYSVPHLWGTAGLVFNTNFVPSDISSWSVLLDKKYRGKIALMDDPREVMTVLLKLSGFSLNSKDPGQLKLAEENGKKLKANKVTFGDTIGNIEKVMTGELWIAEAYSGDVFYKIGDRKDIKFVNPQEGFSIWADYLCLSYDSKNPEGAYALINYFMRPDMSARSVNTFCCASPIDGSEKYINKNILTNHIVYPPGEIMDKGEFYIELGETNKEYMRIFNSVKQ